MNKITAVLFAVIFFIFGGLSTGCVSVFAEEFYGRAETSTVGFYASEIDENPMFYLPCGYYVYITAETDDFYYCEYAKSESSYTKKYGFVRKDEIYIDSEMALPLFPEIALTAIKDTNLYSKTNKATIISSITAGQNAYFYGVYQDDTTTMYYVKISGDFGYVDTSGFEALTIPTHPKLLSTDSTGIVIESAEEESEVFEESQTAESSKLDLFSFDAQIAMILCATLPALALIFFIFKPSSDEVTRYFDS